MQEASPAPLKKSPRAVLFASAAGVMFAPFLMSGMLLAVLVGGRLWHCAPVWSDELCYWNEVAAFEHAGLNGGYTVINERPARGSCFHFGPHGPAVPMLYGTVAKVFGWSEFSGPFFGGTILLLA